MTETYGVPLTWLPTEAKLSFWKKLLYFSSNKKNYYCIRDQLASRTDAVWQLWPTGRRDLAKGISRLIAEEIRWPNSFFIPDDPCEILLWEHSSSIYLDSALTGITELLLGKITPPDELLELYSQLHDLRYGFFVDRIAILVEDTRVL